MPGLEVLIWLESVRNPLANVFFHAASELGSELAYMAILVVCYLCCDHRFGFHLLVMFLLGVYANAQLKALFDTARPYVMYPDRVHALYQSGVYGAAYPSGHATNATVVWGLIAVRARRRALRWGAVVLAVAIAFSRVYLGVHWPADVVGGILAGAALLLIYLQLVTLWDQGRLRLSAKDWAVLLVVVIAVMLAFGWPDDASVRVVGALAGASVGFWLLRRHGYNARAPLGIQILKVTLALGSLLAVRVLLTAWLGHAPLAALVRYAFTSFMTAYLIPVAFTSWGLAPRSVPAEVQ